MKNCRQADVELDAALEHLEHISEYVEENLWTYRRKIGTFRCEKLDAESDYLAEILLFNLIPTFLVQFWRAVSQNDFTWKVIFFNLCDF